MGRAHLAKITFVLFCLFGLSGCGTVALSVAGLAAKKGLDHTLDGTVDRTYVAPVAGTYIATLRTLKRMGMTITKREKQENIWMIEAETANRQIEIEIEPLSDLSSQARVEVSQSDFSLVKDSSTGNGILEQIAIDLSRISDEKQRVATVQMLLAALGYDPGGIDGLKGRNTRRAIRSFQREHAIRPDGDISRRLITKLRSQMASHEVGKQE
jgi:hypothetical protein